VCLLTAVGITCCVRLRQSTTVDTAAEMEVAAVDAKAFPPPAKDHRPQKTRVAGGRQWKTSDVAEERPPASGNEAERPNASDVFTPFDRWFEENVAVKPAFEAGG